MQTSRGEGSFWRRYIQFVYEASVAFLKYSLRTFIVTISVGGVGCFGHFACAEGLVNE